MASANETVLLKSTLEINNKPYSVKLTPGELYWEKVSPSRAASGPYSEPLVSEYQHNQHDYLHLYLCVIVCV